MGAGDSSRSGATAAGTTGSDPVRLHLLVGWLALLLFLGLGAVLEALHALKVDFYLHAANETRRLMWTLAHAHGTLLALVNLALAFTLRTAPMPEPRRRTASWCVIASTVLLPVGFLLGGIDIRGGDPGLAVLLVPPGAILLLGGVFLVTLHLRSDSGTPRDASAGAEGAEALGRAEPVGTGRVPEP